ncbi:hypothetical protein MMC22_007841 [Lobaria immixta]|nr:hypothetical protein [Lobaria immixta]
MGNETLIEFLDEEDSLTSQLKAFDRSDAERNRLINKICHENHALKEELRQKSIAYDVELQARRSWQSQAEKVAELLEHTQISTQSQNYLLVLIDGNSCLFLEAFLWKGAAGGADAADKLYVALQKHFEYLDPARARPWKIVLRVYLDLDDLFRRLRLAGFYHDLERIHQFSRGFTQRQPLFDLVDVGHFGQLVPLKIEELFGVCINGVQCRQVLLGCHIDDLATIVRQHRMDALAMSRITFLKPTGSQIDPPFASLAKVEFPSVFRTSPLPSGVPPVPAGMVLSDNSGQSALQNWNNGHLLSEPSKPKTPLESHSLVPNGHNSTSFKSKTNGHAPSPSQSSNGHHSDLQQLNANDRIPSPTQTLPTTWAPNQRIVLLNVNDERVDSNLGPIDADASARVAERFEQQKVCNDFHLRDKCRTSGCTFSHEPRLDPKELVVLRYKARYLVCERGSACRIPDCWHGHMCSSRSCPRPVSCRFKDLHHVDKTAVKVWGGSESRKA